MSWSRPLRIGWWVVLSAACVAFLWLRHAALMAGTTGAFDAVVLLVLLGLLLSPLFSEVELWGLAFRRELRQVKTELKNDLADVKLSIVGLTQQTVSQSFYLSPPPDASLPAAKDRIVQATEEVREHVESRSRATPPPAPSDQSSELFMIRYGIDREIRRIATGRELITQAPGFEGRRSTLALTRVLESAEVIPPDLATGIRDVYAICSRAVHAEPVTAAQLDFARTVGPKIVEALWRLV